MPIRAILKGVVKLKIVLTRDIKHSFIGLDMKEYPPVKKFDVIKIDKNSANILIKRRYAKAV